MKVVLLQKVEGLGKVDEVKEVSDGYARNFLFPKHLAVQASAKAVMEVEARQKRVVKEAITDLQQQQSLAARVEGLELVFKEKVNEKGLLYSALSAVKISDKLKSLGYNIDKKQVVVVPIKSIGDHSAEIKFRHGLEAKITITVSA